MSDEPKLPDVKEVLEKLDIKEVVEKIKAGLAEHKKDEQDRRTLSGKFYPGEGICGVCQGTVVPDIHFDSNGRIGGPPPQGYVDHFHCKKCGLMYQHLPK